MSEIMSEADKLEFEIYEKALKLAQLRSSEPGLEIPDYTFQTLSGETSLKALFGGRDRMLAIHNMGQGCRYCTLWADGLNGVLDHLEDTFSVVMLSKDPPEIQRRMAMDRGWRFRLASHGGGAYMAEQSVMTGNYPGAVIYERSGDAIIRKARARFGPGDLYSPVWHMLSLAGIDSEAWTPQFHYWQRPQKLDDGGDNIKE